MAEIRKVIVEIRNESKSNKSSAVVKKGNKSVVDIQNVINPSNEHKEEALSMSVFVQEAYKMNVQTVKNTIDLTLNRYFTMEEDYIGNTRFNNFIKGANVIMSYGSSMISGAKMGAIMGGPIGAAAGAVAGGVSNILGVIMQHQSRLSEYHQALNASNMQTQFNRERAGLSDNGRGTEN